MERTQNKLDLITEEELIENLGFDNISEENEDGTSKSSMRSLAMIMEKESTRSPLQIKNSEDSKEDSKAGNKEELSQSESYMSSASSF